MDVDQARQAVVETVAKLVDDGLLVGTWGNVSIRVDRDRMMVRGAVKALRGRGAVLLANHGAVCVGRDIKEAHACCLVLEKACRAFIEGEFLGGARPIGGIEARLLRQYYLRHYSKLRRRG